MHVETGSMHACPAGRAHRTLPLWGYLMCTARPSFWFCAPIPARSASSALQSLNIPPKPGKEKGEFRFVYPQPIRLRTNPTLVREKQKSLVHHHQLAPLTSSMLVLPTCTSK